MRLLTFDEVCTGGIEILTKCEQRNIAHMAVFCARKTCHFATFFSFDFNKYKSKACSLFLRSINMMLVLFYQVCTGGIEELTERQSYIIGHIDVLGEKKELFKLCGVITSEPQNISSIWKHICQTIFICEHRERKDFRLVCYLAPAYFSEIKWSIFEQNRCMSDGGLCYLHLWKKGMHPDIEWFPLVKI